MSPLAIAHLVVFLVLLPALVLRSVGSTGRPLPSRSRILGQTLVLMVGLGSFSAWVAVELGIPLFGPVGWYPEAVVAALVTMAAMLATIPPRWAQAPDHRRARLMRTRPASRADLAGWLLISVAAGVFEEISYRGTLYAIVAYGTGSPLVGALVSAAAFAVAHAIQGRVAVAIVFGFALVAQGLVWWTDTLVYAMVMHATYDLLAGLVYLRLASRDGVPSVSATGEGG